MDGFMRFGQPVAHPPMLPYDRALTDKGAGVTTVSPWSYEHMPRDQELARKGGPALSPLG
jgi:hypothetical protein